MVDITTSTELMTAYGEQIPVTFVDGRQHDFWRVDEARLRRALAEPRSGALTQPAGSNAPDSLRIAPRCRDTCHMC